jgi:DNA-binding response OmpR family regulator
VKDRAASHAFPDARVLVVDDEAEVRSSLARLLALLGYSCDVAGCGRSALEMSRRADYDVVVLDIRMPGLDGVEVMQSMHREDPGLPIILLTGHASLDSAVAAVKSKAADYLVKPVGSDDLALAISTALERDGRARGVRTSTDERFLRVGCLMLDRQSRLAYVDGERSQSSRAAELTPSEAEILTHLMLHPGLVCSCAELAQAALAYEVDETEARIIVRPHICRLRSKIEPEPADPRLVRTAAERGYVFSG